MIEMEDLYRKYREGEPLSVEECQWLVSCSVDLRHVKLEIKIL